MSPPSDPRARLLAAYSLDEVIAERCRRSYAYFVCAAWPNVPRLSGTTLRWNWHHDAVCLHAQEVARGRIRDALFNMPPGTMKTELLGVFFLPWVWTWRPDYKVISASITQKLANEASGFCRQVVECEWYQKNFARGWELREDKNAINHFANTLGGSRYATSVGGTVIGMRADCLVGDDLQKDGDTQVEWDKSWTYWTGTMSSRSVNPATVAKLIVQQRLGKGDISDKMLEHASSTLVHVRLPMEFDPARRSMTVVAGKELWRDPRTHEGELLNPRCDTPEVAREVVERAKSYATGVGPHKYKAQYNQDPALDRGGEVERSMWRFYRHPKISGTHRPEGCDTSPAIEMPRRFDVKILSMDTAVEEGEENDYTVIGSVAHAGALAFVGAWLDRQRVDIMGMERMVRSQVELEPDAGRKIVEKKASGTPLVQRLKSDVRGLEAIDPGRMSKVERMRLYALPSIAAGQVYLPEGAPWLDVFVAEWSAFPSGRHDDMVDFLTQGLRHTVAKGAKKRGIMGLEW